MKILSVYNSLLCFLFCTFSSSLAGKITNRRSYCGEEFKWNEGLKGVKLLDDCMLLKNNLILKDKVMQITEKTECINSVHLTINNVEMETDWKTTGRPLRSREIKFKNGLQKEPPQKPVTAEFTARNEGSDVIFVSRFDLDLKNCSGEEVKVYLIIAGVSSLILIVAVVALVVWKKKKGNSAKGANNFNTDENHTYGTYSRGWEDGGEYGDGDKVYVKDSNDYYAS